MTWLEKQKTVQNIGKAQNAGVAATPPDIAAGAIDVEH